MTQAPIIFSLRLVLPNHETYVHEKIDYGTFFELMINLKPNTHILNPEVRTL